MPGETPADKDKEKLRQLVFETCSYPPVSAERRKGLTQIIRLIKPKLWKDTSPNYPDALQQTWLFFCNNICESTTAPQYDPDLGSIVTWLNAYLKHRLQDFRIDEAKENNHRSIYVLGQGMPDFLTALEAKPEIPPILETVLEWAEADTQGELSRLHIEGHPQVTCQILILRRLPPETSWQQLSQEFGLSISTLSSFYRRQCLPRLRKFGQFEGFL